MWSIVPLLPLKGIKRISIDCPWLVQIPMNRQKIKYFVFRFGLGLLPDKWFFNLIRFVNAIRFKKGFYLLSDSCFFGQIQRMKVSNPNPEMILLADKSKMRARLHYLYGLTDFVQMLGVYNSVDDLLSADLKYPCVVKMNRGSGMNMVVHSRAELTSKGSLDTFRFWFSVDPYYYSREPHYSKMSPCFVVEEYLGNCLDDFKFFCFKGKPMFIQVDVDRFNCHKRRFYDLDWNPLDFGLIYPKPTSVINPPEVLEKMIETASLISKSFDFIRVDFYIHNDKPLLGECTFFPEGGLGLFDNKEQDLQIGGLFIDQAPIV